ncbi:hypothetical protein N7537_001559 [Penicillium hordei]|uniref:Uncharacterized protein n=1 Tax=Penicillium hordei TaxID=40994 RepID=A0AAD6EFS7_9EURO|nr:uncharacterized protein N7537_001559 [Penicillium hordei]KAJ5616445.1 hypothetical protein N7537_001559 [Penicillium hordei]
MFDAGPITGFWKHMEKSDTYLGIHLAIGQSGENDVWGGLDIRLSQPFAEVGMLWDIPFNGY